MVKTNEKKILLVKNKQNSIKTKKKNVENCIFKEKKANNNCGYRKQLDSIAEKDPEFFRYLKEQEADLLDFNESDIDLSEDSDEHSVEMDISDSQQDVHMDDMYSGKTKLDQDGGRFIDNPPISAIKTAVDLFSACVARVGVFERIVRMCFAHLGKLLFVKLKPVDSLNMKLKNGEKCRKIGKLSSNSVMYRFRKWKKYNSLVKSYLNYLLLFLNELQSPDVLVCTLHAITEVISLYGHFNKLTRNLIKSLVRIWSRKTDECRCAAFIAIFKFIRSNKSIYSAIIKACYFGYVTNVREVTPESWPLITFMQKSFAEICFIDIAISYQYAFMYIRQTAIHLRNAMIAKRKDLIQTVYNWQFIQCLYLWATVISRVARSEDRVYIRRDDIFQRLHGLMELAYPLCQITIATFKLYPSPKFLPLKLHCIRILLLLQVNCNIYIPALSLAVQLCDDAVNMVLKKPKKGKGTIRAVDITCMIKASSSHMEENGYRHKALDALFKVLLEAAYILRSSCAFPDLIVPLNVQVNFYPYHLLVSCMTIDLFPYITYNILKALSVVVDQLNMLTFSNL
ncbi:unnamed protein product [Dracunculus medinensis]|uniref:Nucleolar complex protein 2 homolog n=1 Tax=Dracunculus medinensis TaxID=318479 RepID=A0A0N4ULK9_DRAME|nr:unnamed protein product [Dracunculus medinensis]